MVDPLTIIGAAASIASIVDLLGKTVGTLHTLRSRWKEADFTFVNLVAQLIALKSALSKLQEWMDTDVDEPHHQLVMDLEASVTCCRMLVRRIDSEVEDLQEKSGTGLDAQSKIKLLMKNGTLEELQKMVDRQTGALTLLLTVWNYKAIGEQKMMLEKPSTRRVIKRVKDDASSLYVQPDSMSIYSRCTDNLSKISKMFEFDRELFVSKVYEKVLLGSLKDTVENIRQKQQRPGVMVSREERDRGLIIERDIKTHAVRLKRESRVLLLGEHDCVQVFIKNMKIIHGDGFTNDDRRMYKEVVMKHMMRVMEGMVLVQKNGDTDLDNAARIQAELLSQEIEAIQAGDGKITIEGAGAIQVLWKDILKRDLKYEAYIPDSSSYFIEEIQRIAQEDYLPTDADILKLGGVTPDKPRVQEHRLTMGQLSLHMFDADSQRSERRKWIHQFEGCISIAFFVDLSRYDEHPPGEPDQNHMMDSLLLFDSVINSHWFRRASIILLLCNVGRFKEKLLSKPLVDYFPDCPSGSTFNGSAKYILWRFNQLNRGNLNLYQHLCDPSDDYMRFIWPCVQDSIILNNLKQLQPRGL
ncbi:hypothetical protein VF21_02237 [Pseudogymnoascus sp. 05NY08]|nr:hypothetical protein VF21_02237 [Pseudogymnoascus sp. 05NY08]